MINISISTTTHLCNNPRLVKELSSLSLSTDYNVEVIYFSFNPKKAEYDKEIVLKYPQIKFRKILWYRISPTRILCTTISKLLKAFNRSFKIAIWSEQQLFPGHLKLLQTLKNTNSDIYHGHNLGTLASVVNIAKTKNKKVIFDAEDFHRGETKSTELANKLTIAIEDKYICKLDALISASPLITKEYEYLYPMIKHVNINNVFEINNNKQTFESNFTLNCVWFSQVVGLDRGLQDIIKGINEVKVGKIKLDIIGNINPRIREVLSSLIQNPLHKLNFIPTVSTNELDKRLVNYDVGIASEVFPNYNRNICLTNKIFQYMSAGLAILASNTTAQVKLMKSIPDIGHTYAVSNVEEITNILNNWIINPNLLIKYKATSKAVCLTKYRWEIESQKFLSLINSII